MADNSQAIITGRDYKGYQYGVANSGTSQIRVPYSLPGPISQPPGSTGSVYEGTQALFNRYYTFFYSGPYGANGGAAGTQSTNYFESDDGWAMNDARRNPTAATIINWARQGSAVNCIDYAWEDFLYCKHYGRVPNNYMVTLRRFGMPVTDNLINSKNMTTPDVGRMVAWMDGESNKMDDLLKFNVKLKWKEHKSSIEAKSGGGSKGTGDGSLVGKILGATDSKGSKAALKGNANSDPYSNMTNKTLGPINVVDAMQVRDRGLFFTQSLKIVFEYENRSIDGINGKIAFLDLIMNVLMVTYNRGDFWGGAIRYTGGSKSSNPLAGEEGMAKLAAGDFGGFLDSMVTGMSSRLDDLTGGAGLSMEGIGNAMKSVGGNIASRAAGGAMDKMGRPQAQATMALLTGEDTGEWHITIGNPLRPIMSLGNMILEDTSIQLLGPLDKDDFPTKLKVECTLKPARSRDRDDVQMMFVPNNAERLYSSALDYVKQTYSGQVGPDFGGNGDQVQARKQDPHGNISEADKKELAEDTRAFDANIAHRFPNHAAGVVANAQKWTT